MRNCLLGTFASHGGQAQALRHRPFSAGSRRNCASLHGFVPDQRADWVFPERSRRRHDQAASQVTGNSACRRRRLVRLTRPIDARCEHTGASTSALMRVGDSETDTRRASTSALKIQAATLCRVCSVISNWTGRCVFCCINATQRLYPFPEGLSPYANWQPPGPQIGRNSLIA